LPRIGMPITQPGNFPLPQGGWVCCGEETGCHSRRLWGRTLGPQVLICAAPGGPTHSPSGRRGRCDAGHGCGYQGRYPGRRTVEALGSAPAGEQRYQHPGGSWAPPCRGRGMTNPNDTHHIDRSLNPCSRCRCQCRRTVRLGARPSDRASPDWVTSWTAWVPLGTASPPPPAPEAFGRWC
jgi:hypothetical protein